MAGASHREPWRPVGSRMRAVTRSASGASRIFLIARACQSYLCTLVRVIVSPVLSLIFETNFVDYQRSKIPINTNFEACFSTQVPCQPVPHSFAQVHFDFAGTAICPQVNGPKREKRKRAFARFEVPVDPVGKYLSEIRRRYAQVEKAETMAIS